MLRMYKAAAVLSALMNFMLFLFMIEVTLILDWFYRAAQNLCTFWQVHLVRNMQHHQMVCVIPAV